MPSFPERLAALQPFWNEWYLDEFLGKGSYGEVYRIRKTDALGTDYHAALKWLWIPQDTNDVRSLRRHFSDTQIKEKYRADATALREEILVMKKLSGNSHIVDCEDFQLNERGDEPGWDILIRMELLTSLPDRYAQGMTVGDVIDLGSDICDALTLLEREDVIHRDIKPDNIFVASNGNYKLGDFGVAKQMAETVSSMSRQGTPMYMAPEVYKNEATADHSVDLYSLGLVMHELLNRLRMPLVALTDHIPTSPERDAAFNARVFSRLPIPAPVDGSVALKKVICKACAYEPNKRFGSAAEMKESLLKAKEKTRLNDPLTPNPVLGVGLNSNRSDVRFEPAKPNTDIEKENAAGSYKNRESNDRKQTIPADANFQLLNPSRIAPPKKKRFLFGVAAMALIMLVVGGATIIRGLINSESSKDPPSQADETVITEITDEPTSTKTSMVLATSAITPKEKAELLATPAPTLTQTTSVSPTDTPAPIAEIIDISSQALTGTTPPTATRTPTPTPMPIQDTPVEQALTAKESGDYAFTANIGEKTAAITGFLNKSVTHVDVPAVIDGFRVTSIGDNVFEGCKKLTQVNLPDSLSFIGRNVFSGCDALTQLSIPASVSVISSDAFNHCPNLIIHVDAGTHAHYYAMRHSITFTIDNMDRSEQFGYIIGDDGITLYDCYSSDEDIVLPSQINGIPVVGLGADLFAFRSERRTISIPETVTNIHPTALTSCYDLEGIYVHAKNKQYIDIDGVLFKKSMDVLLQYPCKKAGDTYQVPEGVKTIGTGAFMHTTNVKEIVLPNSVVSLKSESFCRSNALEKLVIPASVTDISNGYSAGEDASLFEWPALSLLPQKLVIYAPEGSCAQQYAQENSISINVIDDEYNSATESTSNTDELRYHFQDAGIEERARHSLGKESDEIITPEEWAAITSFDFEVWMDENTATLFRGQPIHSLEDFKYCTELERLSLTQLYTNDFSPLYPLEKLTALDISEGSPEIIDSITNLKHLKYLLLDDIEMPVADIPGIENLQSLNTVSLSNCSIIDITPIRKLEVLKNLEYLDLSDNEIEDVSALSNMTSLVNLILPNNRIQDTSPLYQVQQVGVNITLDGNPTTEVMKSTVAISLTPEPTQAPTVSPAIKTTDTPFVSATASLSSPESTDSNAFASSTSGLGELSAFKTTSKTQMFKDEALTEKASVAIPKGSILYSHGENVSTAIQTSYYGNEGYVSVSDTVQLHTTKETVTFDDPTMGFYIRRELGLIEGIPKSIEIGGKIYPRIVSDYADITVYLSDLQRVTRLSIDGEAESTRKYWNAPSMPKSYEDLRLLPNLEYFYYQNNYSLASGKIPVDVRLFADCKKLQTIETKDVYFSHAESFEKLASLTVLSVDNNWAWGSTMPDKHAKEMAKAIYPSSLETLSLVGVRSGTTENLSNLVNLKTLNLTNNSLVDISNLAALQNLRHLVLDSGEIAGLGRSKNPYAFHEESRNKISDLSPLIDLPMLQELSVQYNRVSNFFPLLQSKSLKSTICTGNPIDDEAPLLALEERGIKVQLIVENEETGWPEAKKLSESNIVFPSAEVENVVRTALHTADRTASEPLRYSDVKAITILDLSGMKIKDVSFLRYFTEVVELNLSDNNVSDISVLRCLTNLEKLDISGNNIKDLEPLSNLIKLHTLNVSNNNITDIASLKNLKHMVILDLSSNPISEASVLSEFIILQKLNVTDTRISKLPSLEKMNLSYQDQVDAYLAVGDNLRAAIMYRRAGEVIKAAQTFNLDGLISVDENGAAFAVSIDGKILQSPIVASNSKKADAIREAASKAKKIAQIQAGTSYIIAIDKEGSAQKIYDANKSQTSFSNWRNMNKLTRSFSMFIGLTNDGKILSTMDRKGFEGKFADTIQKALSFVENNWVQMVDVRIWGYSLIGLKQDGTLLFSTWEDIPNQECVICKNVEYICHSLYYSNFYCLLSDGSLLEFRANGDTTVIDNQVKIGEWPDMVAVYRTKSALVGLKQDGTLEIIKRGGNCQMLEQWEDIVALAGNDEAFWGVKSDGSVVVNDPDIDVSDWRIF